jgi:tetratricopeptide (TPR) repeat protein
VAKRGDDDAALDRVLGQLAEAPFGLHDVGAPAAELPAGWPAALRELYAVADGARLYVESLELVPAGEVVAEGERWKFARWEGDDVWVDRRGRVWRRDATVDDDVVDGTSVVRWLAGAVDACALVFDGEGEYFEDVFDDDGELRADVIERQARAQLKRDPKAPGPRWRLARCLLASDQIERARDELEEVVAVAPEMVWAWLDLSRTSEQLGELPGAIDEATAAAEAAAGHDYEGYAWAQVARLHKAAGNEPLRAKAAERAVAASPDLRAAQLAGARASLADGDLASARGLVDLLRAIAPRDLEVLALAKELETAQPAPPEDESSDED